MHSIRYKNSYCTWDEALPLGNGHFGAMVYNEGNELVYAINHYDVYYNKLDTRNYDYGKADNNIEEGFTVSRRQMIEERAIKARNDEYDPAHVNYNYVLKPENKDFYGWDRKGRTMPMVGELRFTLNETVKNSVDFESCLEIESATYKYSAKTEKGNLKLSSIVGCDIDALITKVEQNGGNCVDSIELVLPDRRYFKVSKEYKVYNDETVYCIGSFYPSGEAEEKTEPFHYILINKIIGAKINNISENGAKSKLDISCGSEDFIVITCVVTQEETKDILEAALEKVDAVEKRLSDICKEHTQKWGSFWAKSKICISDKMLEKLWYLHIYSLECSSGKGARIYQHACGLNGLWDIRQPSQWGSKWYWDVNIEQSFWPVYTSNHLEIGEAFYKGLLYYVNDAKKKAEEFYGFRGIAADYPFEFFLCIWPWCAQYFWWNYRYSNDVVFLREKAYPLFKDILLFFEDYIEFDGEKGQYSIFPDISPEQGPVTKNATITIACLKFLLKVAIEAGEILNESKEDRRRWGDILHRLSPYPTGESREFGKTIKDAEWAEPTQHLAHAGLLMPVYPIGEINKNSNDDIKRIAINTVLYTDRAQSLGTHNFGWAACAAARLGCGDEAIRILYEKGIAFFMRANGMFAEETERGTQNCCTTHYPSYQPALMEAGSATVAAINEMLLQSHSGVIEVFPSLPKGVKKEKKKEGIYDDVADDGVETAGGWNDCYFETLLAEGAFEISAYQKGAETSLVRIKSLAGNDVSIVNPFSQDVISLMCEGDDVDYELSGNVISFATEKGKTYELSTIENDLHGNSASASSGICKKETQENRLLTYMAPSKRKVFLGKDEETVFFRKLDNMLYDYYQGDIRTSRVTTYKFDFSLPREVMGKDYSVSLPRQYHACGKLGLDFIRITKDSKFSRYAGFGWDDINGLEYIDTGMHDPLRRDYICSSRKAGFKIELPKGQYQVFIATGDFTEPTYTTVEIDGQIKWKPDGIIPAGRFEAAVLPILQEKDDILSIGFKSIKGHKWKINMLLINRIL